MRAEFWCLNLSQTFKTERERERDERMVLNWSVRNQT